MSNDIKINGWVIVPPDSPPDHTTMCIKKNDCILDFIEGENMLMTMIGNAPASDWDSFEEEGYKCQPATLIVHDEKDEQNDV